jgi:transcription elongation factor Elf1
MAIEVVQHGVAWINEEDLKLKCPECGKKQKTAEITVDGSTTTVTFTCQRCHCIYKIEREDS